MMSLGLEQLETIVDGLQYLQQLEDHRHKRGIIEL